jgi:hypothetical protein
MEEKIDRKYLIAGIAGVIILGAGTTYAIWSEGGVPPPYESTTIATSSAPAVPPPAPVEEEEPMNRYGDVGVALGETATFPGGLSIRPISVLEDSRCPQNAQCIRAGTVKVSVRIDSALGASTKTFEPGTTITTEAESITLQAVFPEPLVGQPVPENAYRFVFEVRKRPGSDVSATVPSPRGRCHVGGCSSQLCTDDPDAASTCEYRAEYACYTGARCERQANGTCGWTKTDELSACLANPPSLGGEE